MLIFCTLSLIGLLYSKNTKKDSAPKEKISLKQETGSYIKNIQTAEDKLYIHVIGGGREDRIIIFDANENKVISTIEIN